MDKHGLEATFLVEAGVTAVCFLLGLLFKNPTHVKETSIDYTEKKTTHAKHWRITLKRNWLCVESWKRGDLTKLLKRPEQYSLLSESV